MGHGDDDELDSEGPPVPPKQLPPPDDRTWRHPSELDEPRPPFRRPRR